MATYRLSVTTISRTTGRSAVAAAAYRAAARLTNDRDGHTHDYRSRTRHVAASGIMAPDAAPDWVGDRAQLWNAAEAAENRKNSVTAREIQVSLPYELDDQARLLLVQELSTEVVNRYGVAVDYAIHRPDAKGDARNHHAHLLLTTRRITAEGFTEKTRELDDRSAGPDGGKSRGVLEVEHLREHWCQLENQALERAGIAQRVDHRSYERQGLDREPEPRLGPHAHAMQQRGAPTLKGDWQQAIRRGDLAQAQDLAILFHARQVEAHDHQNIPERSRSPRDRQWPYQQPAHYTRAMNLGVARAFNRQAVNPWAVPAANPPRAAATAPPAAPDPLKTYAEAPLAKNWRDHYAKQRVIALDLAKAQERSRQRFLGTLPAEPPPAGRPKRGLANLFRQVAEPASAVAAREAIKADRAAKLAAFEKRLAAERQAFAEEDRRKRQALARSLTKAKRPASPMPHIPLPPLGGDDEFDDPYERKHKPRLPSF